MTSDVQIFADIGFYLVAAVILLSALFVLFARKVVHAALALLPCLLGIAGMYALLGAHLLFAVQVLIYAGAITVLILFAVMMLQRVLGGGVLAGSHNLLAGLVAAGAMFVVLLIALLTTSFGPVAGGGVGEGNVEKIGQALLTKDLLAFETISVVILAAIIGAVVIARKRGEGE
jgi:NADH-quinone oxidoreductase subunit J